MSTPSSRPDLDDDATLAGWRRYGLSLTGCLALLVAFVIGALRGATSTVEKRDPMAFGDAYQNCRNVRDLVDRVGGEDARVIVGSSAGLQNVDVEALDEALHEMGVPGLTYDLALVGAKADLIHLLTRRLVRRLEADHRRVRLALVDLALVVLREGFHTRGPSYEFEGRRAIFAGDGLGFAGLLDQPGRASNDLALHYVMGDIPPPKLYDWLLDPPPPQCIEQEVFIDDRGREPFARAMREFCVGFDEVFPHGLLADPQFRGGRPRGFPRTEASYARIAEVYNSFKAPWWEPEVLGVMEETPIDSDAMGEMTATATELKRVADEVLFVRFPVDHTVFELSPSAMGTSMEAIEDLQRTTGVGVLDLSDDGTLSSTDFVDLMHLNSLGARKWSKVFAERLGREVLAHHEASAAGKAISP